MFSGRLNKSLTMNKYVECLAGIIFLMAAPVAGQTEIPEFPEHPPEEWPVYHLLHPYPGDFWPADPNMAFYYKGLYHLHYLYPSGEGGLGMIHVSSRDMVHWTFHPIVLRPDSLGHPMLSGTGFFTKKGDPAIIYSDNKNVMIRLALDDRLDSWSEPRKLIPENKEGHAVESNVWDPDCWLDGDTYYAIGGGKDPDLKRSPDLKNWEYLGSLMHEDFPGNLGLTPFDDVSCPNMFRLKDKWVLLCISHALGCRYYIGDFRDGKYLPETHALMNWEDVNLKHTENQYRSLGTFFAPESLLTADGRRVMWAWLFPAGDRLQNGVQSLPRELDLSDKGTLLIRPLRELETLRYDTRTYDELHVKNQVAYPLKGMSGDAMEIEIVFEPLKTTYEINKDHVWHIPQSYGLNVLCNEKGENGVPVRIYPARKILSIAGVSAPLDVPADQETVLRIFIDKGIIEVFVNDLQAMVYAHKRSHPHAHHYMLSNQGDIRVRRVSAWKMRSAWKNQE